MSAGLETLEISMRVGLEVSFWEFFGSSNPSAVNKELCQYVFIQGRTSVCHAVDYLWCGSPRVAS